jgi:hypothetical protein
MEEKGSVGEEQKEGSWKSNERKQLTISLFCVYFLVL